MIPPMQKYSRSANEETEAPVVIPRVGGGSGSTAAPVPDFFASGSARASLASSLGLAANGAAGTVAGVASPATAFASSTSFSSSSREADADDEREAEMTRLRADNERLAAMNKKLLKMATEAALHEED